MEIMKKILFLASIAILGACRKDPIPPIGDRQGNTAGFEGSWVVSKVVYVDSTQAVPETMEVTPFFVSQPDSLYQIVFSMSTMTYTVTNPGPGGLNQLGNAGSFWFIPTDFPEFIGFYTDQGDSLTGNLLRLVRPIDTQMGFSLAGRDCSKNIVAYQYTFARQ
jgi:hypothetical protein